MTDYQKQILKNIQHIEKFIKKGELTKEQIAFYCKRDAGIGKRFTIEYIEDGIQNNIFQIIKKEGVEIIIMYGG